MVGEEEEVTAQDSGRAKWSLLAAELASEVTVGELRGCDNVGSCLTKIAPDLSDELFWWFRCSAGRKVKSS